MENAVASTTSATDLLAGLPTVDEFARSIPKKSGKPYSARQVYRWAQKGDIVLVDYLGQKRVDIAASKKRQVEKSRKAAAK